MMTGSCDPVIFYWCIHKPLIPPFDKDYNLVMTVVVSLRDFAGEMQMLSDDCSTYLNKIMDELITIE
jgi:hypothetical protein